MPKEPRTAAAAFPEDQRSPSTKHRRFLASDDAQEVVTMAPMSLALGLRLGVGDSSSEREQGRRVEEPAARRWAMTFMQQQELEHQVLIYKYLVAGAPVPVHLVFPIWKSVAAAAAAASVGSAHFPASLIGLGSICYDYHGDEPEPGRCRRTDGKKWRCSRDVVAGHKYCERHVHRGRGRRSRMSVVAPAASRSGSGSGNVELTLLRRPHRSPRAQRASDEGLARTGSSDAL